MYGPSFKNIALTTGKAFLKDMNYTGETTDVLLLIDPATAAYDELMYVTEDVAKEVIDPNAVAGWYKDNGDDTYTYRGETEIALGCGFWIFTANGTADMTAAGEVKDSFTRTLPSGLYSSFANPFPMECALEKFVYTGETTDVMLLVDPLTGAYDELMYVTEDVAKEVIDISAVAGWYKDNGDDTYTYRGKDTLLPGQGCWIFTANGEATISATL